MEKVKLNEEEVEMLLHNLCVKLGFCLPPPLMKRLIHSPPTSAKRFAEVVFEAEGLDPNSSKELYEQVLAYIARAFANHHVHDQSQPEL